MADTKTIQRPAFDGVSVMLDPRNHCAFCGSPMSHHEDETGPLLRCEGVCGCIIRGNTMPELLCVFDLKPDSYHADMGRATQRLNRVIEAVFILSDAPGLDPKTATAARDELLKDLKEF